MKSEELKNLDNFDNILDFIALRFKIGMNPKCCKKPWKLTTFEHSFDKFDCNNSITLDFDHFLKSELSKIDVNICLLEHHLLQN